jgi:hypothetical protein
MEPLPIKWPLPDVVEEFRLELSRMECEARRSIAKRNEYLWADDVINSETYPPMISELAA